MLDIIEYNIKYNIGDNMVLANVIEVTHKIINHVDTWSALLHTVFM